MNKSITILGSTGSIGKQTVDLIEHNLSQYTVEAITANDSFELLAQQAKRLRAKRAVIANEAHYQNLKNSLANTNIEALAGRNALIECANIPVDISIIAIVGMTCLLPTLQAMKNAKIVGLANKETLVCAGNIINSMSNIAKIIPIDSEHNAIFQIYDNQKIESITLTASGGPFYQGKTDTTINSAINHPIWKMGQKISVDSATMMNKVLEVIEAHYLFSLPLSKINILIHPEAIVHGMVSYHDGNNIAVLSNPNMKIPIAYALNWPKRQQLPYSLDLTKIKSLSFHKPYHTQFPALELIETSNYIALNAANEVAVRAFLDKKIHFDQIVHITANIISHYPYYTAHSIDEVIAYDKEIRSITNEKILHQS